MSPCREGAEYVLKRCWVGVRKAVLGYLYTGRQAKNGLVTQVFSSDRNRMAIEKKPWLLLGSLVLRLTKLMVHHKLHKYCHPACCAQSATVPATFVCPHCWFLLTQPCSLTKKSLLILSCYTCVQSNQSVSRNLSVRVEKVLSPCRKGVESLSRNLWICIKIFFWSVLVEWWVRIEKVMSPCREIYQSMSRKYWVGVGEVMSWCWDFFGRCRWSAESVLVEW